MKLTESSARTIIKWYAIAKDHGLLLDDDDELAEEIKAVMKGTGTQFKVGDKVIHIKEEKLGVGIITEMRNVSAWVLWGNGLSGCPHLKSLERYYS